MLLVVDANVIFSVLIAAGGTFDIFLANRMLKKFEFVAPEYLFVEIEGHFEEIAEKTKLSIENLEKVYRFLEKEIDFIPFEEFNDSHDKAEEISPDPDDVAYLALSLKLDCPLWSNDRALKRQSVVKVFSTDELARLLGCLK